VRLGFREEGILPAAERIGDRIIDHMIYAVSDREWQRLAELRIDRLRA
jgi:RimJ/RimL family protein N-acetyltransferase